MEKSRSRSRHAEVLLAFLLPLLLGGAPRADACGPHFPNRILDAGQDAFASVPAADFGKELEQVDLPDPGFRAVLRDNSWDDYQSTTVAIDLEEAREALRESGANATEAAFDLASYASLSTNARRGVDPGPDAGPSGLPAEFLRYLRGAAAWHREEAADARQTWAGLLDRPEEERPRRSVWAAYMIARSLEEADPALARRWYAWVRRLAARGFSDRLGLATASLGREARLALAEGEYRMATRLYAAQLAAGDRSAEPSLLVTIRLAFDEGLPALEEMATDPVARSVVTVYVLARGGRRGQGVGYAPPPPELSRAWLDALEAVPDVPVREAEHLAWACYRYGDLEGAGRWAERAPDTDMGGWVRTRLLLRSGRLAEAEEAIETLARRFPPVEVDDGPPLGFDYERFGHRQRLLGELGVLRFARGDYADALSALLDGDLWEDAAYVAERVLTPDELISFVRDRDIVDSDLRYLLARRLFRIGRREEALAYFPDPWRRRAEELRAALVWAEDRYRLPPDRAAAYWAAARVMRKYGLELIGTELEPDWACYGGSFERGSFLGGRTDPAGGPLFLAGPEERARVDASGAWPERRWHYRYLAADLAWEATKLMPDEDEETARVLCIAGGWLKARDPKAADRFYKAMVIRCGSTPLGRAADRIRWFPPLDGR